MKYSECHSVQMSCLFILWNGVDNSCKADYANMCVCVCVCARVCVRVLFSVIVSVIQTPSSLLSSAFVFLTTSYLTFNFCLSLCLTNACLAFLPFVFCLSVCLSVYMYNLKNSFLSPWTPHAVICISLSAYNKKL